jgi:hypothetical protein
VDLASTGSIFTFCENYTKTTNAARSKPQCEMAIEERNASLLTPWGFECYLGLYPLECGKKGNKLLQQ